MAVSSSKYEINRYHDCMESFSIHTVYQMILVIKENKNHQENKELSGQKCFAGFDKKTNTTKIPAFRNL